MMRLESIRGLVIGEFGDLVIEGPCRAAIASSLSRRELDEVPENRQADVARLLRMKLDAGDLAALDDRGEPLAVLGDGDGVGGDRARIAVREIHLRAVGDAVDDRVAAGDGE